MNTAFIIGNGESRNIFPIEELKGKGVIYGCNAIYRDYPDLCDNIVAVNPPMYDELQQWKGKTNTKLKLYGPHNISKWNYLMPEDKESDCPDGLKLYRIWRGGNYEKHGNQIRTIDFSVQRGSGMSAVLLAAEAGIKHIMILAFDILGSRQWEHDANGTVSREQNNIYKNTENYPSRMNMKAYLKYEWMYQLRQVIRKFPEINFYWINRKENIFSNHFLPHYFADGNTVLNNKKQMPNIKVGTYGDLKRWTSGQAESINWIKL